MNKMISKAYYKFQYNLSNNLYLLMIMLITFHTATYEIQKKISIN